MRVLDLFSGIGGFSLGLESAGFETVAFCEIEAFPCKVLAKHWPDVPIYNDVTELTGDRLKADGIAIDVITAGFPCQDISHAGKGAGIKDGTRSGLWSEVARLTSELRPQYVILENVAAILGRGADIVLGDLAEIGYDAEWHCIPASAVGAPHRRDRWWCVAWNASSSGQPKVGKVSAGADTNTDRGSSDVAYPNLPGCEQSNKTLARGIPEQSYGGSIQPGKDVPNTHQQRLQGWIQDGIINAKRRQVQGIGSAAKRSAGWERDGNGSWATEPAVGRVAHGIPNRVDRLKGLGNAVVPQIPAIIGQAIMELEKQ